MFTKSTERPRSLGASNDKIQNLLRRSTHCSVVARARFGPRECVWHCVFHSQCSTAFGAITAATSTTSTTSAVAAPSTHSFSCKARLEPGLSCQRHNPVALQPTPVLMAVAYQPQWWHPIKLYPVRSQRRRRRARQHC